MHVRHYLERLEEYLRYFPCVAVIGARQCGKTTLVEQLPDTWRHFDLERPDDYEQVVRDPGLFLRLHPNQIAIDEAQLAPQLFAALRVAIDADRSRTGRFVITGSSSPALVDAISESLAGRVAVIEMSPLSISEAFRQPLSPLFIGIASRQSVDGLVDSLEPRIHTRDVHAYWMHGGYPEPWTRNDERFRKLWMDQYVQTYIHRDVARLFPGLNRDRFQLLVRMLGGLSGTLVNYSHVARALSVSQPTARDYLNIAEGTFLWRSLPSFSRNPMRRVVRRPRGFMRDTGLLHHLLRIPDADTLRVHPQLGASWQAMVSEELIRGLHMTGTSFEAMHYRTAGGAEVDLVLEGDFGLVPVEIKYGSSIPRRQLRAIRDFVSEYDCPYGIVVSNDRAVRRLDDRLIGVPATCL